MVTISTIFFPLETIRTYLPAPFVTLAEGNPLSIATQALRESAFGTAPLTSGILTSLLATSLPLAVLGAVAYWTILRVIRVRGKS